MTDLATLLHSPLYGLLYALIVKLHVAAGALALITFWIAAAARKSRQGLHVKAGRVYLIAMRGILVTAAPMALAAFLDGKIQIEGDLTLFMVHEQLITRLTREP